jgi:hypothetical protein
MSIPRWASKDVRLLRTADFAWSKSGNLNTLFGVARRFFGNRFFAIVHGPPNRETMMLQLRSGKDGASSDNSRVVEETVALTFHYGRDGSGVVMMLTRRNTVRAATVGTSAIVASPRDQPMVGSGRWRPSRSTPTKSATSRTPTVFTSGSAGTTTRKMRSGSRSTRWIRGSNRSVHLGMSSRNEINDLA